MLFRPAVDAYNYPETYKSVVYDVPLDLVHSLGMEQDSVEDSGVINPGSDSTKTEDVSGQLNGETPDTAAVSDRGSSDETAPGRLEASISDGSIREKESTEAVSIQETDLSLNSAAEVSSPFL